MLVMISFLWMVNGVKFWVGGFRVGGGDDGVRDPIRSKECCCGCGIGVGIKDPMRSTEGCCEVRSEFDGVVGSIDGVGVAFSPRRSKVWGGFVWSFFGSLSLSSSSLLL